jgi:hypothetical protein
MLSFLFTDGQLNWTELRLNCTPFWLTTELQRNSWLTTGLDYCCFSLYNLGSDHNTENTSVAKQWIYANHTENTSCDAGFIVACAYFGRCLKMGLHAIKVFYILLCILIFIFRILHKQIHCDLRTAIQKLFGRSGGSNTRSSSQLCNGHTKRHCTLQLIFCIAPINRWKSIANESLRIA